MLNKTKKVLGVGLVAVVTSLSFTTGALASDEGVTKSNDVSVTIESGGFHLETSSIDDFEKVTLNKDEKTYKTSFKDKFTVTDLRGSHDGWRLDVSASTFSNGDHELPKGSLTLEPVSNVEGVGSGYVDLPSVSMDSNKVIDDGSVKVLSASAGKGMGEFDFKFPSNALTLNVDASTAKTGTYTSTLTWDLVQAP